LSALLSAAMTGPDGHVVAFEPSPITLERLKRNVAINQAFNISIIDRAAADFEGQAPFCEQGSRSRMGRYSAGKPAALTTVSTVRLDDFVYRDGHRAPHLLKIDVEGSAGLCLAGMQELLSSQRPTILLELHDPEEEADVRGLLTSHGYTSASLSKDNTFPRHSLAEPK
jgi:FkbM family methyltransferase